MKYNLTNLLDVRCIKCARMAHLDDCWPIVMVDELMAKVPAFDKQFLQIRSFAIAVSESLC